MDRTKCLRDPLPPRDVFLCPRSLKTNTKRVKLPKMTSWGSGPLFLNLHATQPHSEAAKFTALYDQVSEHDRLIVDRMLRKRHNELAMVEDARIARRFWDEERRIRQQELLEQTELMTRLMKERRQQDTEDTIARLENLRLRDRFLTARLREELDAKECLADLRLQRLSDLREHQTHERRQQQQEKALQIAHNNEESFLDQKLQQQLIIGHLEEKIHRADTQRQRYIEAQRSRVQFDNELEQRHHQAKRLENQRFEEFQRQRLLDTIRRSDQKTRAVLRNKQRELEASRSHARNSAFLRDFVRRSFTPEDVNSFNANLLLFSTRSFKSV